jgi:hypothetical protein
MILGSHCSDYEDGCLLVCSSMKTGMSLPTFSEVCTASIMRVMVTLMTEAVWTFEMSVNLYQSTQRYNPAVSHLQLVVNTARIT